MPSSRDRILTTHVGSLPRPQAVVDQLFAEDQGESLDRAAYDAVMCHAVADVVLEEKKAGVDIVSDGEMSKISYATYIRHRLTGFEIGDMPRSPPKDLDDYPEDRLARMGGTPKYHRPICCGPIAVRDLSALHKDIANLKWGMATHGVACGFPRRDRRVSAERVLQESGAVYRCARRCDASGVRGDRRRGLAADRRAGSRHGPPYPFPRRRRAEFLRNADLQVEALSHALANVPSDRVRMHLCWGNYEGPHHHDVALEDHAGGAEGEAGCHFVRGANPRHAHEWDLWQETKIPEDKVLVPGVIDSVTNFIEHPRLVAQRIDTFAAIVGRERVIASTDCGFGTFAGFGAVVRRSPTPSSPRWPRARAWPRSDCGRERDDRDDAPEAEPQRHRPVAPQDF